MLEFSWVRISQKKKNRKVFRLRKSLEKDHPQYIKIYLSQNFYLKKIWRIAKMIIGSDITWFCPNSKLQQFFRHNFFRKVMITLSEQQIFGSISIFSKRTIYIGPVGWSFPHGQMLNLIDFHFPIAATFCHNSG